MLCPEKRSRTNRSPSRGTRFRPQTAAPSRRCSIPPIRADRPLPCLIDFHGGGFVFKAAPHHFALARAYATQTPCAVLFPDYRLLSEHRFPAPVEDAYSSLLWLDSGERFRCRPVSGLFRGVGHGDSRRGPVADALGMGDGAWTAYLIK